MQFYRIAQNDSPKLHSGQVVNSLIGYLTLIANVERRYSIVSVELQWDLWIVAGIYKFPSTALLQNVN